MRKLIALSLVLTSCFAPACESLDSAAVADFLGAGELSDATIVDGLKEALEQGTKRSVADLSKRGGYGGNPELRIELPEQLSKFAATLRKVGLSGELDAFEEKMNVAAEQAASQAVPVFTDAITKMTFDDARKILDGNKTSATKYFERTTKARLVTLYEPTVERHMAEVGAVRLFDELVAKYDAMPFVPALDFSLESYVTERALDGLFQSLGEVERDIRTNPAARVTDVLRRVFASQE